MDVYVVTDEDSKFIGVYNSLDAIGLDFANLSGMTYLVTEDYVAFKDTDDKIIETLNVEKTEVKTS